MKTGHRVLEFSVNGRFNIRKRFLRSEEECVLAVFILKTHYQSGRIWADICSSPGYAPLDV